MTTILVSAETPVGFVPFPLFGEESNGAPLSFICMVRRHSQARGVYGEIPLTTNTVGVIGKAGSHLGSGGVFPDLKTMRETDAETSGVVSRCFVTSGDAEKLRWVSVNVNAATRLEAICFAAHVATSAPTVALVRLAHKGGKLPAFWYSMSGNVGQRFCFVACSYGGDALVFGEHPLSRGPILSDTLEIASDISILGRLGGPTAFPTLRPSIERVRRRCGQPPLSLLSDLARTDLFSTDQLHLLINVLHSQEPSPTHYPPVLPLAGVKDALSTCAAYRHFASQGRRNRFLLCHDVKDGPPEETGDCDVFNASILPTKTSSTFGDSLYHCTYFDIVDTFVYFTHYRVSIPPTSLVTACHRGCGVQRRGGYGSVAGCEGHASGAGSGIRILGTVIFEGARGTEELISLLNGTLFSGEFPVDFSYCFLKEALGFVKFNDSQVENLIKTQRVRCIQYCVNALVSLAIVNGFDGYFLNVESQIFSENTSLCTQNDMRFMHFFVRLLTLTVHKFVSCRGSSEEQHFAQVLWYDSIDGYSGEISFQNCLSNKNRFFFEASDGLFTNYWWTRLHLRFTEFNYMDYAAGLCIKATWRETLWRALLYFFGCAAPVPRPPLTSNSLSDVYIGVDFFGRCPSGLSTVCLNTPERSLLCSAETIRVAVQESVSSEAIAKVHGCQSIALFAPAGTSTFADNETLQGTEWNGYDFYNRCDTVFGNTLRRVLCNITQDKKSEDIVVLGTLLSLPFQSRFCKPFGTHFFIAGSKLSEGMEGCWSQLSAGDSPLATVVPAVEREKGKDALVRAALELTDEKLLTVCELREDAGGPRTCSTFPLFVTSDKCVFEGTSAAHVRLSELLNACRVAESNCACAVRFLHGNVTLPSSANKFVLSAALRVSKQITLSHLLNWSFALSCAAQDDSKITKYVKAGENQLTTMKVFADDWFFCQWHVSTVQCESFALTDVLLSVSEQSEGEEYGNAELSLGALSIHVDDDTQSVECGSELNESSNRLSASVQVFEAVQVMHTHAPTRYKAFLTIDSVPQLNTDIISLAVFIRYEKESGVANEGWIFCGIHYYPIFVSGKIKVPLNNFEPPSADARRELYFTVRVIPGCFSVGGLHLPDSYEASLNEWICTATVEEDICF